MIRSITTTHDLLGECPVWSPSDRKLYWIDIRKPALYALDTESGAMESWDMPENLGGLTLRQKGGLVVGMQRRIAAFDPQSGTLEDLVVFDDVAPGMRFNDAKCDLKGRFWACTMLDPADVIGGRVVDVRERMPVGEIYALEQNLACRQLADGFVVPNGFAWSPDSRIMYLAETFTNHIFAYDYDVDSGTFSNRRVFAQAPAGKPDGAAIDAEGFLWSACAGGWCLARYRPDGKLDRQVELPVQQPTSVAFGGRNLETLYITTATQRLTPEQLTEQPLAGTVLAMEVGVRGLPEPAFAG